MPRADACARYALLLRASMLARLFSPLMLAIRLFHYFRYAAC